MLFEHIFDAQKYNLKLKFWVEVQRKFEFILVLPRKKDIKKSYIESKKKKKGVSSKPSGDYIVAPIFCLLS